jgi:hypothetical protein
VDEIHLTVDTQILVIGVDADHEQHLPCHKNFLAQIDARAFLALDGESLEKKGQILVEYEKEMPTNSDGRRWLAQMAKKDRLRFYKKLNTLPKQVRVKLNDNEHFSKNVQKWVRLAMATPTKRIVSEDDDFSESVCRLLAAKPLRVTVHTAQSACDWICANFLVDPPV